MKIIRTILSAGMALGASSNGGDTECVASLCAH